MIFKASIHMRIRSSAIPLLFAVIPAAAFGQLNTTNFVVLGEGLAAGMADFSLRDVYQAQSFPAQIAGQLKTAFPQPLIEPPGLGGGAPGFPNVEVTLPNRGMSSAREIFPPQLFVFNLSVPGLKLADSAGRRPVRPMVQKTDAMQTMINMILGYPAITLASTVPLWSQSEYAVAMNPSMALVELGYYDVLDAAVKGDVTLLPDATTFQTNYTKLLSTIGVSRPTIVVTTVPNPFDTAYFTTLTGATRLLGAAPADLINLYGLKSDDLITIPGLMAIGSQLTTGTPGVLPAGSIVSGSVASQVTARVAALNTAINAAATASNALVYDLGGFFSRLRTQGVTVGTQQLTADYLGGIYSLDGYYPGTTAHSLIANEILTLLNSKFGTSYALVNVVTQSASDPALRFRPAVRKAKSPNVIGGKQ